MDAGERDTVVGEDARRWLEGRLTSQDYFARAYQLELAASRANVARALRPGRRRLRALDRGENASR